MIPAYIHVRLNWNSPLTCPRVEVFCNTPWTGWCKHCSVRILIEARGVGGRGHRQIPNIAQHTRGGGVTWAGVGLFHSITASFPPPPQHYFFRWSASEVSVRKLRCDFLCFLGETLGVGGWSSSCSGGLPGCPTPLAIFLSNRLPPLRCTSCRFSCVTMLRAESPPLRLACTEGA